MKSILVIGLGRFGSHLAQKLLELGNDVMVVDENEALVNEVSNQFTDAMIGDCTKESTVDALGVSNFDICFVTIGSSFQASLEIVFNLKEKGAKYIVAKAAKESQAKFLKLVGADEVVYPEKDMADSLAYEYSNELGSLVNFGDDFSLAEVDVPSQWVGLTIVEVDCRKRYGVNIVALKTADQTTVKINSDTVFTKGSTMIISGLREDLIKFTKIRKRKIKVNK